MSAQQQKRKRILLTNEQRSALVADAKAGLTIKDLIEKYGVSAPTVSTIKRNAGVTRGSAKIAASVDGVKTIAVPTTQAQLDQAVRKLVYEHVKHIKGPNDEVLAEVKIKVGAKSYTFQQLIDEVKTRQEVEEKQKLIEHHKTELAKLGIKI